MTKLFKVLCLGLSIMIIGTFPLAGAMQSTDQLNSINGVEAPEKPETEEDVVSVISTQENLMTLFMLLNHARLSEKLSGEGPFTVFAPSDEAFNAVGEEKLESLLTPDKSEKLKAILKNHVVPKDLNAADISGETKVKTLGGEELTIKKQNGKIIVNDAEVTEGDLEADNGVIHIIDKVLIPSNDKKMMPAHDKKMMPSHDKKMMMPAHDKKMMPSHDRK